MNKVFVLQSILKTGVIVCLFFSLPVVAQDWTFTPVKQLLYDETLRLNQRPDDSLLSGDIQSDYIQSLREALELLMIENSPNFDVYEERFEKRIDRYDGNSADELFLNSELDLQWTFIHLKAGNELDAALHLRHAYKKAESCRKNHPGFIPIRRTNGVLNIILGSVPEKYQWVLDLLGMEGSITDGLKDLEVAMKSATFGREARLMYSLVHTFILQKTDIGANQITDLIALEPNNRLFLFLGASALIKDSRSESALTYLTALDSLNDGVPLPYQYYLAGEALLHKGKYDESIRSYRKFLSGYAGSNYVKDSHYKIGLCYYLSGKKKDAEDAFRLARQNGVENGEADKSAAENLANEKLPHVELTRVRYFTDGGYYEEAQRVLSALSAASFTSLHDRAEYFYRQARLLHKMGDRKGKEYYLKTIETSGDNHWYFAPNACLQLGYLFLMESNTSEARKFFEKALTYKKHEYKNSIDSKAKSALDQIDRK